MSFYFYITCCFIEHLRDLVLKHSPEYLARSAQVQCILVKGGEWRSAFWLIMMHSGKGGEFENSSYLFMNPRKCSYSLALTK